MAVVPRNGKRLEPRDFPPLPGFEHIARFWDGHRQTLVAKLLPGEYYVTRRDEMVTTVLGSCVSACARDPVARVGGMNHFMLPEHAEGSTGSWDPREVNAATRYGSYAMEHLINEMLKAGAARERIEVKLFGGGRVLRLDIDVADRNIAFAIAYLEAEGLRLVARDLGGPHPRKVNYFPVSGRALVKKLTRMHSKTIVERERQYLSAIERKPVAGEVEFF